MREALREGVEQQQNKLFAEVAIRIVREQDQSRKSGREEGLLEGHKVGYAEGFKQGKDEERDEWVSAGHSLVRPPASA
jgi:hypothetical protein